MWRALDVLGALKWPSLIAIGVLPLWFYATDWREGFAGDGPVLYAPELVAGLPVVVSHATDAEPLHDEAVRWTLRLCTGCQEGLRAARLALGGCEAAPSRWTEAHGAHGYLQALVTAPAGPASVSAPAGRCLWVELERRDGSKEARGWPLGQKPPINDTERE